MPGLAEQINGFLTKRGSPLAGMGNVFVAAGKKYGIDPRLAVAISGIESSFGKHIFGDHNAWGWGPGRTFGSWEEGIHAVTKGLRSGYFDRGLTTPDTIVSRWAPASDGNDEKRWASTVSSFLTEMGAAGPLSARPSGARSPSMAAAPNMTPAPPPGAFKPDYTPFAQATLGRVAQRGGISGEDLLASLAGEVRGQRAQWAASIAQQPDQAANLTGGTTTPTAQQGAEIGSTNPMLRKALRTAMAQIGKPYVWGGESPREGGFDCSGLIDYAFRQAGYRLPAGRLTTWSMAGMGASVKGEKMRAGDWIITNGGKHVVMYVGGNRVIAAPHRGAVVRFQPISDFADSIVDVRRFA